jgi:hypothetical protein
MRRREFIAGLGAGAVWPLAAWAQQPRRMRRVGVLMNLAADDPEGQACLAAFLQGLQEAGWAVGRNLRVDIRWRAADAEQRSKYAAELAALVPDVILAEANDNVSALRLAQLDSSGKEQLRVSRLFVAQTLQLLPRHSGLNKQPPRPAASASEMGHNLLRATASRSPFRLLTKLM